MEFKVQRWVDVCDALDLDPESTLSINIAPGWVRIVHADYAVTSAELVDPEREAAAAAEAQRLADQELAAAIAAAAAAEEE